MITVRLPTVDSVSAYLESVQDEVAAVLFAGGAPVEIHACLVRAGIKIKQRNGQRG